VLGAGRNGLEGLDLYVHLSRRGADRGKGSGRVISVGYPIYRLGLFNRGKCGKCGKCGRTCLEVLVPAIGDLGGAA
jgi:hypothetical protein